MKHFDLLALYKPQSCIQGDKERYVEIKHVRNYEEFRLCRTKGNVNLTDYWFSMVEASKEQPAGYNCQFISLISDEDEKTGWEKGYSQRWICLAFFKFRLEEMKKSIKEMQEVIEQKLGAVEHRWFRTLDNADSILIFFAADRSELERIRDRIQNVTQDRDEGGDKKNQKEETVYFTDYYLSGEWSLSAKNGKENEKSKIRIEKLEFCQGEKRPRGELKEGGWCAWTIGEFKKKIKQYEEEKNKKMIAYYQGLLQIINVISQYEQDNLLKDMFYIFYPPLSLLRKQLEEGEKKAEEYSKSAAEQNCSEKIDKKYIQLQKVETGISEFLDAVEMLMRHMGQSCPDMINDTGRQGLPYDIPLRLCLMYIAYLNILTDLLNDREYEYRYCLAPLVYSRPTTNFIDFGLRPESRLILVKISRHCMFTPRSSMIILAHEVSHYANTEARQRKLRCDCYIECVSILVTCAIIPDNILHECGISEKKRMKNLEIYLSLVKQKIQRYIKDALKNRIDEEYEKEQEDIYHLGRLFESVWRICLDLLYDRKGELRKRICRIDKKLMKELNLLEYKEGLVRDIHKLQETMLTRTMNISAEDDLHKYMQNLKTIFKETYTDLSSILLLDLKPTDYLEAILISESYNPDIDLIDTVLIVRVSLVRIAMMEIQELNQWEDKWKKIKSEDLKNNAFLCGLKEKVDKFCNQFAKYEKRKSKNAPQDENRIRQKDMPKENDYTEQYMDAIADEGNLLFCGQIVTIEKDYFVKCGQILNEHIEKRDQEMTKQILRGLYEQFAVYEKNKDSSTQDFFAAYDKLIKCYKNRVKKKWRKECENFQKNEESS